MPWSCAAPPVRAEAGRGPRRERLRAVPDARPADGDAVGREPAVGARVLVVDDEPSMRLLCTLNLGMAGYAVTEASSGSEALELLEAEAFDLVLLDVMLPDIGGHELGRRLAAETRSTPVAFISARAHWTDVREGYEAGAVDYITKPFDPTALPGRVREILDRVERGETERYRLDRLSELRR
jgi:DNA-binding response OmpR family regulator